MKKFITKHYKSLIIVGVLLVSLPWTIGLVQKAVEYLTGAAFRPAAIVVSSDQTQGQLRNIWGGVAQGFEKRGWRIIPAITSRQAWTSQRRRKSTGARVIRYMTRKSH